jgi:hypothetical protein
VTLKTKKHYYVYTIKVGGVVRFVGKGYKKRLYAHITEAERINRKRREGFQSAGVASPLVSQKLADAMRRKRKIECTILENKLENKEAWEIAYHRIKEIHKRKPYQLWQVVPQVPKVWTHGFWKYKDAAGIQQNFRHELIDVVTKHSNEGCSPIVLSYVLEDITKRVKRFPHKL